MLLKIGSVHLPYTTDWYRENCVIQHVYFGELTLEEIDQSAQDTVRLLDSSDQSQVHVLVGVSDMSAFPRKLGALQFALNPALKHPKYGWLLVYGFANPVFQFFFQVITTISQTRARAYDEQAEALAFLRVVDRIAIDEEPPYV